MDAIFQPSDLLAHRDPLPLSIEGVLRPIALDARPDFSSYFTGADPSAAAGTAGISAKQPLSPVLAQQFDQDVLGDMRNIWNNFVESGQLWALLFGIVLGYMIRNLTAY
jgi:hypothetical protein